MNILTAPVIPAFRLPKAISPTVPTTGSSPGFAGPPTTMVQPPIRRPSSTVGIKRSPVGTSLSFIASYLPRRFIQQKTPPCASNRSLSVRMGSRLPTGKNK